MATIVVFIQYNFKQLQILSNQTKFSFRLGLSWDWRSFSWLAARIRLILETQPMPNVSKLFLGNLLLGVVTILYQNEVYPNRYLRLYTISRWLTRMPMIVRVNKLLAHCAKSLWTLVPGFLCPNGGGGIPKF